MFLFDRRLFRDRERNPSKPAPWARIRGAINNTSRPLRHLKIGSLEARFGDIARTAAPAPRPEICHAHSDARTVQRGVDAQPYPDLFLRHPIQFCGSAYPAQAVVA